MAQKNSTRLQMNLTLGELEMICSAIRLRIESCEENGDKKGVAKWEQVMETARCARSIKI